MQSSSHCTEVSTLSSGPFVKFFSGQLQEWFRVSSQGDSPGIDTFDKVPAIKFYL